MPSNDGYPPIPGRHGSGDRESPVPVRPLGVRVPGDPAAQSSVPSQMELAFEDRSSAVFQQWLRSMATDAEAALAAAMSYRELSPSGRDQWLSFLEHDVRQLDVPRIAIYAPLLAVEHDPHRRKLLEDLAGEREDATEIVTSPVALGAQKAGGERIFVVICPLYLQFFQVLACGVKNGCFVWVRHDPIVSQPGAPVAGDKMQGARLEAMGFTQALDELAATVLSHQRQGHVLPDAVYMLSDLLGGIGP